MFEATLCRKSVTESSDFFRHLEQVSQQAAGLSPKPQEAKMRVDQLRFSSPSEVSLQDLRLLTANLFSSQSHEIQTKIESIAGLKVIGQFARNNGIVRSMIDREYVVPILGHLAVFGSDRTVRHIAASAFSHPIKQRDGQHLELQYNSACESQWEPGHYFHQRYISPLVSGILPDGKEFKVFEFYHSLLNSEDPEIQTRVLEAIKISGRVKLGSKITSNESSRNELRPILHLAYHHPDPDTRAVAVEIFGYVDLPRDLANGRFLPQAVCALDAVNLTINALIRLEQNQQVLEAASRMIDAMSWRELDIAEAMDAYAARDYLPGFSFKRPNSSREFSALDLCSVLQGRLVRLEQGQDQGQGQSQDVSWHNDQYAVPQHS